MSFYRRCLRPLLFSIDAERVHDCTLVLGERVGANAWGRRALADLFAFADSRLHTQVAGIDFANPLGMAAGFDKNGRIIQALSALGFGFVEIGSVSAHPSAGNPRPRLFRLPRDGAIVVNYGVPNEGAQVVGRRVSGRETAAPLGVNLVETNTGRPSRPDGLVAEFAAAVKPFIGRADYIALNLNCPNTTGGVSPFDEGPYLGDLLREYAALQGLPPVFLKFTAHTDPVRSERLLRVIEPFERVKGFIFNLPPGKPYPLRSPARVVDAMPGTLCGKPVQNMIDGAIGFWYGRMDRRRYSLIGTGGITSPQDAYRKIRLGASLVQLYTGLVYEGPGLVRRINQGLVDLLDRDGLGSVEEAVGVDAVN
ncbi:MAG: quinone-dependent dihydroorotate dehydrogenase [Candidatus Latescibacteria bacterium]|nr:quinone-dependent dihydroorotate dehydrogenase [Candidatus Latescibacterota bacterium]